MSKRCLNCGGDMSGVNKGAKFCSKKCSNRYGYKSRTKKVFLNTVPRPEKKEETLKGVLPDVSPEILNTTDEELSMYQEDDKTLKPPPLRNTVWLNADKNKKDDPSQQGNYEKINKNPPPQFLIKTTQVPNPDHAKYQWLLEGAQKQKAALLKKLSELRAALKVQIDRNGNGWIIAGGAGGAIIACFTTPEGEIELRDKGGKKIGNVTKSGKVIKSGSGSSNDLWVLLLAFLVGGGVGYLVKRITQDSREKDKHQRITALTKAIKEVEEGLEVANYLEQNDQRQLAETPAYLTKTEKTPNPEYNAYLTELEAQKARQKETTDTDSSQLFGDPDDFEKSGEEEKFKPKSSKIYTAKEFGEEPSERLNFKGPWQDFFDLPSTNFHCLVHGNPGEGKSTFCMWFARYLAENFGRVLYVSGEEGRNPTFQQKVKYCEAGVPGLYISDIRTGEEFLNEVSPGEFNFIILDSLSDMDIKAKMMKRIGDVFKDTAFIAIEQNNKSGELFGTNAMKHAFDIIINVINYTAETTKNRFKQRGVSLPTAEFGEDFDKGGTGLKIIKMNRSTETKDSEGGEEDQDDNVKKIV